MKKSGVQEACSHWHQAAVTLFCPHLLCQVPFFFFFIVFGLTVFFVSHRGFVLLKEYETLALDKHLAGRLCSRG